MITGQPSRAGSSPQAPDSSTRARYLQNLANDTGTVLDRAAELLDFTRPVAITMLAILHVIPDSDSPHAIVTRLLDAVPSGSYLAITQLGSDLYSREALEGITDVADRRMHKQVVFRTREQMARFFEGTDLVEPGLVQLEEWRPEPGTA